jgi:hypothetical protein
VSHVTKRELGMMKLISSMAGTGGVNIAKEKDMLFKVKNEVVLIKMASEEKLISKQYGDSVFVKHS